MTPGAIRLVKRDAAGGFAEDAWYEPPAHLRAHILSYQGYTEAIGPVIRRKAFPNRGIVFVINLGDPVGVVNPHVPSRSREHASTFVAGLHERYVVLEQGGLSHGIQVNLTPIGGRLFLRLPMHELANDGAQLEDIFGPVARELTERLREAPGWRAKFELLDEALTARIASAAEAPEAVAWAWSMIDRSGGRASISSIAGELGWSHKRLLREFREQVGLSPKVVGRIARFNRALELARSPARAPWPMIAVASGYYDQAHMIREFREFAGETPLGVVRSQF